MCAAFFVDPFIFFTRGKTAAYMSFRFVFVENGAAAPVHIAVDPKKALVNILVNSGFAHIKNPCRAAHRRVIVYDVLRDLQNAFFNIVFHFIPPENRCNLSARRRARGGNAAQSARQPRRTQGIPPKK